MHHASRTTAAAVVAAAILPIALLTGCAGDPWDQPHAEPTASGSLGAGFVPSIAPSPEATIAPEPGSWDDVHPSPGYRVVLLTAGDDDATTTLVTAITQWASEEKVDMRTIVAAADPVDSIVEALDAKPDLIVSAGNGVIDALTVVSASHLDQHFLVVGAEIAEPTHNVTSVDWTGASFRGEGLNASSEFDASTFTPERCLSAVRAGVAAVLNDLTGIVLWID